MYLKPLCILRLLLHTDFRSIVEQLGISNSARQPRHMNVPHWPGEDVQVQAIATLRKTAIRRREILTFENGRGDGT